MEFGREREGIDLSKVTLTHHNLKNLGKRSMPMNEGEKGKLEPITEAGGGSVQEKEKAMWAQIIAKVNELFQGDLTDQDKLVYVNNVIKGKLLESETLRQQAQNNTKEQFANSPDLKTELTNAIIDALEAHNAMSTQALVSEAIQTGLKMCFSIRLIFTNHFVLAHPRAPPANMVKFCVRNKGDWLPINDID